MPSNADHVPKDSNLKGTGACSSAKASASYVKDAGKSAPKTIVFLAPEAIEWQEHRSILRMVHNEGTVIQ